MPHLLKIVKGAVFSPEKYPTKTEGMLFSQSLSHSGKEAAVGIMFLLYCGEVIGGFIQGVEKRFE